MITGLQKLSLWDGEILEYLSFLVLDKNADPSVLPAKMEKYKELIADPGQDTLKSSLQPVAGYLPWDGITGSFFFAGKSR